MSTRAVIQLRKTDKYENPTNPNNGEKVIQYYHHHDGYTSFLGIELVKILLDLINEKSPEELKYLSDVGFYLEDVLTQRYEKEDPKIIHGDIEYFYLIDFNNGIFLTRYKRNYDIDKEETMNDPTKWQDVEVLMACTDKDKYYSLELLNYTSKIN